MSEAPSVPFLSLFPCVILYGGCSSSVSPGSCQEPILRTRGQMASSVSLLAALRDVAGGADLCISVGDQSLVEFVAAHPLGDPVSATLRQHAALLRSLLNMGVRESRLQVELYNAVRADASAKSILDKIRAALETSFFLGGDAIGSTDVAVASTLFDLLSLGLPPSLVPSVLRRMGLRCALVFFRVRAPGCCCSSARGEARKRRRRAESAAKFDLRAAACARCRAGRRVCSCSMHITRRLRANAMSRMRPRAER